LEPSVYLLVGVWAIIMGAVAILRRRRSLEQGRGLANMFAKVGIRPAPDRAYELTIAWGGAAFIISGAGFIIAGIVMLVRC
jgi:hypothetical protein